MGFVGLLGIITFVSLAYAFSKHRRRVDWRLVFTGLAVQFAIAILLLKVPGPVNALEWIAGLFTSVISASEAGGRFIFGSLADAGGPWGFIFLTKVLPVIIFFASLMAILYHLRIMQRVVGALAWCLQRTLGVSGTESLAAAANVFVGQTEAPLCIKPYIPTMTRSQLTLVMTSGFATIAGSVLAAYVGMLGGDDTAAQVEFAKHLLTASLISAPGSFVMAKLLMPETETIVEASKIEVADERETKSVLDAAAAGAAVGLKLALNVAAMIIAFVALIALVNLPLGWLGNALDIDGGLSLERILGFLFTPAAWLIGVPWADAGEIGSTLGLSVVATEFLAFDSLRNLLATGAVSKEAAIVATYALCGFANLPSVAIQIGGISALAPERRAEIAALGPRAMVAGLLTCWVTACIAGILV